MIAPEEDFSRFLLSPETIEQFFGQIGLGSHLEDLRVDLQNRNYESVTQRLHRGGNDLANAALASLISNMTGLEHAIYGEDWKMATIFFIFGADPKNNVFDGIIQTHASHHGLGDPIVVHPDFEGGAIPGFRGLRLLVDEGDQEGMAFLWLFERMHDKYHMTSILQNLSELKGKVDIVTQDLHFTGDDCEEYVSTSLMCMRQLDVPNDIASRIVREALLAKLWGLLKNFALRGVNVEE